MFKTLAAVVMVLVVGAWAQTEETVTTADGLERTYKLYVPPAQPKGIIVAMHGYGGSYDFFFGEYQITDLADQMNYIVIAPQALPEQDQSVISTITAAKAMVGIDIQTNAVWGCGMKISAPPIPPFLPSGITIELNAAIDDEEFIRQIIEETRMDYNLPAKNIFLFGTSMGGFMAYQYAEKYPEDLSGIISIAGSRGLAIDDGASTMPLPILDFHSDQDEIVPYGGSLQGNVMGSPVNLSMAQPKTDVIAYWVNRNSANIIPNVENYPSANDIEVTKYTYAQTDGNEVIHYKATSLTAGVPKHTYLFSAANGDPIDYAEEIAKFITAHSSEGTPIRLPQIASANQATQIYNGVNLQAAKDVVIEVYSLKGNLINKQKFGSGVHNVSFGHLPKGMYIVKASFGSKKQILRISVR